MLTVDTLKKCIQTLRNVYSCMHHSADVSVKKKPASSSVVCKGESEMTAPASSPGEPVMNHSRLKWTCWTEGGQQTEPEGEMQRKRRKIDKGELTCCK